MPKVLLIIGDAAEVLDTMYAYSRLPEDGFEVVVAAPEKRLYHLVMHEKPPGWDITQERPGYHLPSDIAFRDVRPDEYAASSARADALPSISATMPTCCGSHAGSLSRIGPWRRSATGSRSSPQRTASEISRSQRSPNVRSMPRRRARLMSIARWSWTKTSSRPADGPITRSSSRNSSAC